MIVNPNAGVGKCRKDWNRISNILTQEGFDYDTVFTEERFHATRLIIDAIKKGYRKIISVGGDGTLNEVVNGILMQSTVSSQEIALGVISVGTGNDWIRTYKIPIDYKKSIAIIKEQETFIQDAGRVSYTTPDGEKNRYFVNMAGMGYDGLVARKTNADKEAGKSNPFVYFYHIFSSLFSYQSADCRIYIDGNTLKKKVFTLVVGIGQYNGGGMKQAPDAITNDGLFDLTMIKEVSRWSVIANVNKLYNGTIKKHKQVEVHTGKKITIESDQKILIEVDGESVGYAPFGFQILPNSLKVIVNKEFKK